MTDTLTVQAPAQVPAQVYDNRFVPALFRQWGPVLCRAAAVQPGMRVLDVGCGTGALTLAASEAVGPDGSVVGLDANPEMLAVARAKPTAIDWRDGVAEALPFEEGSFDAVVSQFAFMFFEGRVRALQEMRRVARSGAAIAVAVCGALERSPGYAAFAGLLDRLFGVEVGQAFRAPFVLGDPDTLLALAREAGVAAEVAEHSGKVSFASIEDLVSTERACAWTLGGLLNQAQFARLLAESEQALAPYCDGAGKVVFDMPALLLTFKGG